MLYCRSFQEHSPPRSDMLGEIVSERRLLPPLALGLGRAVRTADHRYHVRTVPIEHLPDAELFPTRPGG